MKNAIILHGYPSRESYYDSSSPSQSNSHWLPWVQQQLIVNDIKADTPEIFKAFTPIYEEWVHEVERFDITPETIIVGHSMGGGFWVRYLSEHPEIQVDKVILVAPWLNVNHEEDIAFFDFEFNPNIASQTKELIIFTSDNDYEDVQNSVTYLRNNLKDATFKEFHEYGHFTIRTLKDGTFSELLERILK